MIRFVAGLLVFLIAPSMALARTWTNREGKKIDGDFVDATEEKVTLRKSDGKEVTFGLDKLCDDDQRFIRSVLTRRAQKKTGSSNDADNPFEASAGPQASAEESAPEPLRGLGTMRDVNEKKKKSKIENREWTDTKGNVVSGKFIRIQGNSVVILRAGRPANLDYWQLSDTDHAYLQELCDANGQSHLIPKINPADRASGPGLAGSPAGGVRGTPGVFNPATPGPTANPPAYPSAATNPGTASSTPPPSSTADPEELARKLRELDGKSTPTTPSFTPPPASFIPPPSITQPPPSFNSPPPSFNSPAPVIPPVSTLPGGTSYPSPTIPPSNFPSTTIPPSTIPSTTFPSATPRIPPSFNTPPTFNSPQPDFNMKQCEKCRKVLPASFTAGDRCPGCGVYFSVDHTNGRTASGVGAGGMSSLSIKGIIVLAVLAIKGFAFMVWRAQR
jgi:hypothetical protein